MRRVPCQVPVRHELRRARRRAERRGDAGGVRRAVHGPGCVQGRRHGLRPLPAHQRERSRQPLLMTHLRSGCKCRREGSARHLRVNVPSRLALARGCFVSSAGRPRALVAPLCACARSSAAAHAPTAVQMGLVGLVGFHGFHGGGVPRREGGRSLHPQRHDKALAWSWGRWGSCQRCAGWPSLQLGLQTACLWT